MQWTQYLIFEIGPDCNLAEEHHGRCPVDQPARWASVPGDYRLDDRMIVRCAEIAYKEMGFRGLVGWHYYCEPMLYYDRMLRLMAAVKESVPRAGFVLWTNGTPLRPKTPGLEQFAQIWISNYRHQDWSWLGRRGPRITVLSGGLDNRLARLPHADCQRCLRPYNELILDCRGNGRLCCMDW